MAGHRDISIVGLGITGRIAMVTIGSKGAILSLWISKWKSVKRYEKFADKQLIS